MLRSIIELAPSITTSTKHKKFHSILLITSITMSYMGFECTQCNFKSYANCVIYVPIPSSFKLHMYIMSRFCKVLSIALFSNKPRLENLWAFVSNQKRKVTLCFTKDHVISSQIVMHHIYFNLNINYECSYNNQNHSSPMQC
jgi:hypothetical protein